jgi:hypothetical protein
MGAFALTSNLYASSCWSIRDKGYLEDLELSGVVAFSF